MAFHPIVSFGVYHPEDMVTVQSVFDDVSGCDWFCKSGDCRERFAAFVLRAYRRGWHDPEDLKAICVSMASSRFSMAAMSG
jgi:hypothetical protein